MKFVFLDNIDIDYTVDTPYRLPLGGSQSALCYLAEALAAAGHDVFVVNHTTTPGLVRGVNMYSFADDFVAAFAPAPDVAIVLNRSGWGGQIKPVLDRRTRLVLWMQHADDQPGAQELLDPAERAHYDGFAFVSEWQRRRFVDAFGIDGTLTGVLRNAIGPRCAGLFGPSEPIAAAKTWPAALAYTSTPFRGLDVLLNVFPSIRARRQGVRLKVFSSMRVYHDPSGADPFQALYAKARATEGVEYVGSVPQPELARELRQAAILAYPSTFAETSCIAVMEAMAAGCRVVTTDLGALDETTDGLGILVPTGPDMPVAFADACVAAIDRAAGPESEAELRAQVDHINRTAVWSVRAGEWVAWLDGLAK
jgi:glycosyltransferase involved in cell wall biosynthesis